MVVDGSFRRETALFSESDLMQSLRLKVYMFYKNENILQSNNICNQTPYRHINAIRGPNTNYIQFIVKSGRHSDELAY